MGEFVSRMTAQRRILQVVNAHPWSEELFGLSSQAIDRWTVNNLLARDSEIVSQLRLASDELRFLANRSQVHITDEYRQASGRVATITDQIQVMLRHEK